LPESAGGAGGIGRPPAAPVVSAPAGPPAVPRGPAPARAEEPPPPKRSHRAIIEWVAILVVAVLAAVLLRTFVIQPYYIPSGSMEPTLKVGDKVLVNKLSYHFHSVHRGDVVVFSRPPNDYSADIKDLIKRVIGLPNETVSASNGRVYVDGRMLNEPWLPKAVATTFPSQIPGCRPAPAGACRIPAGDYFVMGDNRGNSEDSRFIGPIAGHLIVGRAFLLVWPLGRIGTL
jgi:signal peptidase I